MCGLRIHVCRPQASLCQSPLTLLHPSGCRKGAGSRTGDRSYPSALVVFVVLCVLLWSSACFASTLSNHSSVWFVFASSCGGSNILLSSMIGVVICGLLVHQVSARGSCGRACFLLPCLFLVLFRCLGSSCVWFVEKRSILLRRALHRAGSSRCDLE